MKGPALNLHFLLLPYHPNRSKRFLHFDIAFQTHNIEFRQNSSYGVQRTSLSDADLDKSAADEKLVEMIISFQRGPFEWDIDVKRDKGIRVRDVFEAIYAAFDVPLTPHEKNLIPHHRRAVYEEAFRLRCKLAPGLPIDEQRQGWKRVDMLLHETLFRGLTQPKSGGDWVLNLSGAMSTAIANRGYPTSDQISADSTIRSWVERSVSDPIVRHYSLADICTADRLPLTLSLTLKVLHQIRLRPCWNFLMCVADVRPAGLPRIDHISD